VIEPDDASTSPAAGGVRPFGARLAAAMDTRGPLCVGIDPHASLLDAWELPDDPTGLAVFSLSVIEAVGDVVPIVKPQSAFFERHGSRGIAVLERVVAAAHEAGALVLLDAKRGDMGSTMQGYAEAYLTPGAPMFVDAMTVSPYLGFGSLEPVLSAADRHGCGVFVVALTSNPEGPQLQHARRADGQTVAGTVVEEVTARNVGAAPMGSVGLVVGATVGPVAAEHGYDLAAVNGPLLAPGLGAQGARPDDLGPVFGAARHLVLPAVSREVLSAGPSLRAVRDAVARLDDACRTVLAR
jgi:orotidine 5'-phosphate decarboxylase subfamily 2